MEVRAPGGLEEVAGMEVEAKVPQALCSGHKTSPEDARTGVGRKAGRQGLKTSTSRGGHEEEGEKQKSLKGRAFGGTPGVANGPCSSQDSAFPALPAPHFQSKLS